MDDGLKVNSPAVEAVLTFAAESGVLTRGFGAGLVTGLTTFTVGGLRTAGTPFLIGVKSAILGGTIATGFGGTGLAIGLATGLDVELGVGLFATGGFESTREVTEAFAQIVTEVEPVTEP